MNKWFVDSYLTSLFAQCGVKGKWISRKQTSICVDNMKVSTVRVMIDCIGNMGDHLNYTCIWKDREVFLSYSKLNGCGFLYFGLTKEESEKRIVEEKERRINEDLNRKEWIINNPIRLEQKILSIKNYIEHNEKLLQRTLTLLETATDKEHIKELEEDKQYYIIEINDSKKELEDWDR